MATIALSKYAKGLAHVAQKRYIAKFSGAGFSSDPYLLTENNANWEAEPETVPNVKWSDMFVYMITTPSEYTKDEIKVTMKFILEITI